jgi:hypothetical protein
MPLGARRRALLWAILVAVVLGFTVGWLARMWMAPTPDSRARDAFDHIRERAREITR